MLDFDDVKGVFDDGKARCTAFFTRTGFCDRFGLDRLDNRSLDFIVYGNFVVDGKFLFLFHVVCIDYYAFGTRTFLSRRIATVYIAGFGSFTFFAGFFGIFWRCCFRYCSSSYSTR